MGNWLKGRVLINDVSMISDNTQSAQNYQVSFVNRHLFILSTLDVY